MIATRAAPVATAFSNSWSPASPGLSREAAIPEPITAATRNAVPTNSANALRVSEIGVTNEVRARSAAGRLNDRQLTCTDACSGPGIRECRLRRLDDRRVDARAWIRRVEVMRMSSNPAARSSASYSREGQRAGDAADVASRARRAPPGEVVVGHDVGDPDPAARAQHAVHLGEHRRLVGRQVDHAVRDHDVDRRCAGSGMSSM